MQPRPEERWLLAHTRAILNPHTPWTRRPSAARVQQDPLLIMPHHRWSLQGYAAEGRTGSRHEAGGLGGLGVAWIARTLPVTLAALSLASSAQGFDPRDLLFYSHETGQEFFAFVDHGESTTKVAS